MVKTAQANPIKTGYYLPPHDGIQSFSNVSSYILKNEHYLLPFNLSP